MCGWNVSRKIQTIGIRTGTGTGERREVSGFEGWGMGLGWSFLISSSFFLVGDCSFFVVDPNKFVGK